MFGKIIIENGQKKIKPLTADVGAGNPVGTMIAMYKKSNPSGYLYLDGSTFDQAQYPLLYAYLGSNVLPDKDTGRQSTDPYYYIKATSGLSENQQDNVINQLNEQRSYSTDEILTGKTWIDGKPIYRKVYAGLSFTCTLNAWATVSGIQPPQNVEKLIRGWITRNKISTDNITDVINAGVQFSGNLVKVHGNGAFTNCNEIVVEYTKTTD